MDIPHLRFDILQGQDIKFKPGEDVQLDFTFDVEGETGHVIPQDMKYQILVRSPTQENVVDRYNSLFIKENLDLSPVSLDMVTSGGSKLHRYGTLVLNSAAGDVEGIVDITVGISFNCTTNCLMHRLEDTLSLKVYQEGHEGPFRKDFLGFVHDDFRMNSSHFSCSVNSSDCDITCEVVGEGLVGVEIIQTSSSDKPLQSVSQVIGNWGRSFLHIPDVSFEDVGNFSCRTWTQTKGIREQLTLGVAQPVLIDRDASVVTKLENGSFLFTCLAEGIPAPNVTLYDFASGRPVLVNQTHVTHTSQSQTRADAIVNGPRPLSDMGSYKMYCYAANADSYSTIKAFADIMYFYA